MNEKSNQSSGQTLVSERVLEFYRACPFNHYSTAELAATEICASNQIETIYHDLHTILKSPRIESLLDVGCGAGWFTISANHFYDLKTFGIDFNPSVIEIAEQVATQARSAAMFKHCDLFKLTALEREFDVVSSIGVLHHTADPHKGIAGMAEVLSAKPESRLYIGLYHLHGREPFLEYFNELKAKGATEQELFAAYKELHKTIDDDTKLWSWFRDQVLHPHESLHTVEEMSNVLNALGFEIESSSVNRYAKINSLEDLFVAEKQMREISYRRNWKEKIYYPGFFTVCARRFKQ